MIAGTSPGTAPALGEKGHSLGLPGAELRVFCGEEGGRCAGLPALQRRLSKPLTIHF